MYDEVVAELPHIAIPWQSLSEEALAGVVEEFVSREGTDYGSGDFSFDDKCRQVRQQLASGEAVLTFDDESQSCSIVPAREIS